VYEQMENNAADGVLKAPPQTGSFCFVVDDDAGICKALCFTLRKLGFATREIASPAALDRELAEHSPVLVFLDLGLGEHGALDVLPILARHGCKAPVQLMSGRSQAVLDEVVAAGEGQGLRMLPALTKPFRMGVIKELVATVGLPGAPG
jgi:DNA-binding NtrC family response regulator